MLLTAYHDAAPAAAANTAHTAPFAGVRLHRAYHFTRSSPPHERRITLWAFEGSTGDACRMAYFFTAYWANTISRRARTGSPALSRASRFTCRGSLSRRPCSILIRHMEHLLLLLSNWSLPLDAGRQTFSAHCGRDGIIYRVLAFVLLPDKPLRSFRRQRAFLRPPFSAAGPFPAGPVASLLGM